MRNLAHKITHFVGFSHPRMSIAANRQLAEHDEQAVVGVGEGVTGDLSGFGVGHDGVG